METYEEAAGQAELEDIPSSARSAVRSRTELMAVDYPIDPTSCEKCCAFSDELKSLRERIAELEEQLRETQEATDKEKGKLTALYFEHVGDEVGNSASSCSNQTEGHDSTMISAVDQEILLWEAPFQYAKLSFKNPEDPMMYEDDQHIISLRAQLIQLHNSSLFCDLEIRGRGSTSAISCHSFVLCAVSSAIKARLCSKLHRGSELNFENIPHETLTQLVDYAYTGRIGLDEANAFPVYSAADFLDMEFLVASAFKFLSERMNKFDGVSCYKVLRFVEQHDRLQPLNPIYKLGMMEHIVEVFNSVECLMDMSFELVTGILESDFVDFGTETEVVRALNRWVGVDPCRVHCMPALGARIRWGDIKLDPPSGAVEAFKSKLNSTEDSDYNHPKIGLRSRGMVGGFLISYNQGEHPLLFDIQSGKIKVLPKYPDLVYGIGTGTEYRHVIIADSDDGAFYIVSEYDSDGEDSPASFDLLRLNVVEQRWDHVLKHETKIFYRWNMDIRYIVLAGKLCIAGTTGYMSSVECLDLTTSKVIFRIPWGKFRPSVVSAGLSSLFFLHESRKLTRFDARSCTLSDVKIDIPSDELWDQEYKDIDWKDFWEIQFSDGETQFLVHLGSGEPIQCKVVNGHPASSVPLIQESIVALNVAEQGTVNSTPEIFEIYWDRGRLSAWNVWKTVTLPRPGKVRGVGCHFARVLFKNLPDFL